MGVLERPWVGPQTNLAPLGRPGLDRAQAVQSASSEPNGPWSRCRCRTSCAPWTPPPSRVCCGSARGSTSRVSERPRPLRPHGLAADRLPPTRTLETWGLRPGVRIRRCRYPSCVIGATLQLFRATTLASVELVGGGWSLTARQGGDGKSLSSDTQVGGTEPSWAGTVGRIAGGPTVRGLGTQALATGSCCLMILKGQVSPPLRVPSAAPP